MRSLTRLLLIMSLLSIACVAAYGQSGPYQYYALNPCRVIDTRWANGTDGGPVLAGYPATRDFVIRGYCGVPSTAKAVTANITIASPTADSWLALWPAATGWPGNSTINFRTTDPALANGAILTLSTSGAMDITVLNAAGNVHMILDVTGYFQ
jgi:hypothetical protein